MVPAGALAPSIAKPLIERDVVTTSMEVTRAEIARFLDGSKPGLLCVTGEWGWDDSEMIEPSPRLERAKRHSPIWGQSEFSAECHLNLARRRNFEAGPAFCDQSEDRVA
jgi:hypothetical protein